jgi:hypothetical protein
MGCRWRWLSGTILTSLVLDSTGFWVRISARTPILRNITTGGDITGGFYPGAGFPSCHKSIYRVSEDNFRGSACVSEWMLTSVTDGWLVFHNLRLHKDNKLELKKKISEMGDHIVGRSCTGLRVRRYDMSLLYIFC